jgi:hypothetical protein
MDNSNKTEIDKVAKEIERLGKEGDPHGRIQDLNTYLRVLSTRLAMELQQDPDRWTR